MGAEASCTATIGRTRAEGKALLETDAADGLLRVTWTGGRASFLIGPAAEIRPKGSAAISEADVLQAGRAADGIDCRTGL